MGNDNCQILFLLLQYLNTKLDCECHQRITVCMLTGCMLILCAFLAYTIQCVHVARLCYYAEQRPIYTRIYLRHEDCIHVVFSTVICVCSTRYSISQYYCSSDNQAQPHPESDLACCQLRSCGHERLHCQIMRFGHSLDI